VFQGLCELNFSTHNYRINTMTGKLSRKTTKQEKTLKIPKYENRTVFDVDDGGDEGLCPCRCICNPIVMVTCCLFPRGTKLKCLLCCTTCNFSLYRFKRIMCIILILPKIILQFIKHLVCCLGFIIALLALIAALIFLLRTFCNQIISFIDFLFFTGGGLFPIGGGGYYSYALSSLYNSAQNAGITHQDLLFIWNESVPNVSQFLSDFLELLLQVHYRLFENVTDQQSVEMITLSLSQRIEYLWDIVIQIFKVFLQADPVELENLSSISRAITLNFVENQLPISNCFTQYPQLGLQCLLISTVIYGTSQSSLNNYQQDNSMGS
jgi:hypothetical protein